MICVHGYRHLWGLFVSYLNNVLIQGYLYRKLEYLLLIWRQFRKKYSKNSQNAFLVNYVVLYESVRILANVFLGLQPPQMHRTHCTRRVETGNFYLWAVQVSKLPTDIAQQSCKAHLLWSLGLISGVDLFHCGRVLLTWRVKKPSYLAKCFTSYWISLWSTATDILIFDFKLCWSRLMLFKNIGKVDQHPLRQDTA